MSKFDEWLDEVIDLAVDWGVDVEVDTYRYHKFFMKGYSPEGLVQDLFNEIYNGGSDE